MRGEAVNGAHAWDFGPYGNAGSLVTRDGVPFVRVTVVNDHLNPTDTVASLAQAVRAGMSETVAGMANELRQLGNEVEDLSGYIRMQRGQLARLEVMNTSLGKALADIIAVLPAADAKLDDGATLTFVDPNPANTLRMLSERIRRAAGLPELTELRGLTSDDVRRVQAAAKAVPR